LKIYDNAGRLIRTLVDAKENAGRKTVTWDSKDSNNNLVAAGVYFYRLTADGKTASRKMVVVR
jgi:flagellar hook assembly protein FlgD